MTDRRDLWNSIGASIKTFEIPGVVTVNGPEDLKTLEAFLAGDPESKAAFLERLRGREERMNVVSGDAAVQDLVRQMRERIAGAMSDAVPSGSGPCVANPLRMSAAVERFKASKTANDENNPRTLRDKARLLENLVAHVKCDAL